jgi:hypothetical protein
MICRSGLLTLLLIASSIPGRAQRSMPEEPTPAVSTDPKAPIVSHDSRDFESIADLKMLERSDGGITVIATCLLTGTSVQYEEALRIKVWADFNLDREFSADELIFEDARFYEDSVGGKLTFSGEASIPVSQRITDETMLRAVLCYGVTPGHTGHFAYGDVVDRCPPLAVIAPSEIPEVRPGVRRVASFSVVEGHGGALRELRIISPKGTAISLTRTRVKVPSGNLLLGKPHREGAGVVFPVIRASTEPSEVIVSPAMAIAETFRGELGLDLGFAAKVIVARVSVPPALLQRGRLALLIPGHIGISRLAIVEGGAGQLHDGKLVIISPKGTAISLTRTRTRVTRGNMLLGEAVLEGEHRLVIPITRASTLPSLVEVDLALVAGHGAPAFVFVEAAHQADSTDSPAAAMMTTRLNGSAEDEFTTQLGEVVFDPARALAGLVVRPWWHHR